ncbi:MAG: UDP-2,3-diacylglucosamine diphosphatase [Candidatus Krumholzibacteria bacterium]|nr:UDP-2,3-diacylglucosamine diphosphatase [Candidatus Krumholzibacteria bacterium]
MDDYLQIASPEVYFLADSHFCNQQLHGEAERRKLFVDFLEGLADNSALFLLGDIFDFYFEYASVVPKRFFEIFRSLSECGVRGVEMHFLGGNHDYWVGDFLQNQIGIRVHSDDFLVQSQGRKIRCTHGDLLIPDDRGYRTLRAVLRNPLLIELAKILHPDLLTAIASGVSKGSKKRKRRAQEEMANHLADIAKENFFKWDNDVFVMGHVHYPLHRNQDGRDFVIIGDWIDNFSYARLHEGKLSLERFKS